MCAVPRSGSIKHITYDPVFIKHLRYFLPRKYCSSTVARYGFPYNPTQEVWEPSMGLPNAPYSPQTSTHATGQRPHAPPICGDDCGKSMGGALEFFPIPAPYSTFMSREISVCQMMFLHNLYILAGSVKTSLSKCTNGSISPNKSRKHQNRPLHTSAETKASVHAHNSFPRVASNDVCAFLKHRKQTSASRMRTQREAYEQQVPNLRHQQKRSKTAVFRSTVPGNF